MHRLAEEQGNDAVWRMLNEVDPDGAAALHPNNLGRVIRALEIYRSTGLTTRQQHVQSRLEPSPYRSLVLCLDFADRQKLYERIDLRVQDMLRRGLEDEARRFFETYGSDAGTARQAIGCKEFLPYFRGEITYEQAVEAVCRGTRRYAKRQLTWFRRMPDIQTIYADAQTDVFDQAVERIESAGLFVQGG
jgi:tRNA dimethylallyltransferase